MASKTILVDDIDGTEATETVFFALDGASYEVDLNDKNAEALRKALEKYIKVARKASGGRAKTAPKPSGREYEIAELREWAEANEIEVPARGRIPQAIVTQFLEWDAHTK